MVACSDAHSLRRWQQSSEVSLVPIAPPLQPFHHRWEIESKYDQFSDATVVSLASMELSARSERHQERDDRGQLPWAGRAHRFHFGATIGDR
jgi:hypothetical protein